MNRLKAWPRLLSRSNVLHSRTQDVPPTAFGAANGPGSSRDGAIEWFVVDSSHCSQSDSEYNPDFQKMGGLTQDVIPMLDGERMIHMISHRDLEPWRRATVVTQR